MKKKILSLATIVMFLFVMNVKAESKMNIYIFRGEGCPHCEDALNFFDSLDEEIKNKFNLKTYEVWYDEANKKLLTKVSEKLGEEVNSVPYIIVGKKTFLGYDDSIGEEIKNEINTLYDSQEYYDVMEGLNTNDSSDIIVVTIFSLVIIGIITLIIVARKRQ